MFVLYACFSVVVCVVVDNWLLIMHVFGCVCGCVWLHVLVIVCVVVHNVVVCMVVHNRG